MHAVSSEPAGPYSLAPIAGGEPYTLPHGAPAPNASVLVPAFAHAPHAARDPSGALVVVYEGRHPRDLVPPAKQKNCGPAEEADGAAAAKTDDDPGRPEGWAALPHAE